MKKILNKNKLIMYFVFSYILFVPLINKFMVLLENTFKIDLNTININIFNLFTVIFRNGIILFVWLIINAIIFLIIKNVVTTKENMKIEVEGINLKKKDRHLWNSRLGN